MFEVETDAFVARHCIENCPYTELKKLSLKVLSILTRYGSTIVDLEEDEAMEIASEIVEVLETSGWVRESQFEHRLFTFSFFLVSQYFSVGRPTVSLQPIP